MQIWFFLVLLYGIIKGIRDIIKKKALEKSSLMEVLFLYTFLGFIFILPFSGKALQVSSLKLFYVFIKSLAVFIAWLCSFTAIRKVPLGIYGLCDMSGIIFSISFGVLFFNESLTIYRVLGLILVLTGLLFVKLSENKITTQGVSAKYIALLFIACICNSISGAFDKMLMKQMDSGALQFWFMLFLVVLYILYMLVKHIKIDFRAIYKNPLILILSIIFVIGDKALFLANAAGGSTVVVMTLIKQINVIIVILGGRLLYKEKNTLKRILCALLIIAGIVVSYY